MQNQQEPEEAQLQQETTKIWKLKKYNYFLLDFKSISSPLVDPSWHPVATATPVNSVDLSSADRDCFIVGEFCLCPCEQNEGYDIVL